MGLATMGGAACFGLGVGLGLTQLAFPAAAQQRPNIVSQRNNWEVKHVTSC